MTNNIKVITNTPIAINSMDHIQPHGTMRDNSKNPDFNKKLYEIIPVDKVKLLDIGCSGGGLVKSILDDGGMAIGIEGSDYSAKIGRAEWGELYNKNLFTADATHAFNVVCNDYDSVYFNVITFWEFFEHINYSDINRVMYNIHDHIDKKNRNDSFLIGSISPHEYPPWHVTIRSKEWWIDKFYSLGMKHRPDLEEHFAGCMVRSEGFPIALSVK